jgi:multidrug efflux pump subunit AcrA (membrane-fusion protein)
MSLKQSNNILSILCLLFIAFGCNSSKENEGNSEVVESVLQQEINTSSVEVVQPSYNSFISRTMITGVAKAYRKVMVHPMESGYVQSIGKDIGDLVYANDAIAVLYNPELIRAAEKLKAELIAKKSYLRAFKVNSRKYSITITHSATRSLRSRLFDNSSRFERHQR